MKPAWGIPLGSAGWLMCSGNKDREGCARGHPRSPERHGFASGWVTGKPMLQEACMQTYVTWWIFQLVSFSCYTLREENVSKTLISEIDFGSFDSKCPKRNMHSWRNGSPCRNDLKHIKDLKAFETRLLQITSKVTVDLHRCQ
eukprot:scaffold535828_cov25-Prasinocladus_malaysianus.AAC.1